MKTLIAHLGALFTVILWGITFISTKILLVDFSAQEILWIRFLLGWLTLWLLCPHFLPFQDMRVELLFALAGFFGVTLYFLLENIALVHSSASNVGVIVSTAPFFTALVSWLCFKGNRPGTMFFCGFLLAIAGIALISFQDTTININPTGDMLALLAALAWAFYSEITRKLSCLNFGTLRTTRRIFFWGLLLMLPVFALTGWHASRAHLLAWPNLLNLLFLGIGASALCFAIWTYCLDILGTAKASAYIYLVPVVTVLAAAWLLDETITPLMATGMVLVIVGLILSEARWKKARK